MAYIHRAGCLNLEQLGHSINLADWVKGRRRPCYVYDLDHVQSQVGLLNSSFKRPMDIRYAVKANANAQIVRLLADLGVGADVVSAGELTVAMRGGIPPEKIVFSGVGKSEREIWGALKLGVAQINVESLSELERIARIARSLGVKAPVALRMNPNIDAKTHPHISTGLLENKFGIPLLQIPEALHLLKAEPEALRFMGLAIHLGSQITDLEVYQQGARELKRLYQEFCAQGFESSTLDMGGGFPVSYEDDDQQKIHAWVGRYAALMEQEFSDFSGRLLIEPGRFLVAKSGVLLSPVQYIKRTPKKTFVVLSSGMNHLLRPILYGARHRIEPTRRDKNESGAGLQVDVVGPLCESADVLAQNVEMFMPQEGDWLAIRDVGAYGYVMASSYNGHALPQEICFKGGQELKEV